MIKRFLIISFLIFAILVSFVSISYATMPVSNKNPILSFDDILSDESGESNIPSVEDKEDFSDQLENKVEDSSNNTKADIGTTEENGDISISIKDKNDSSSTENNRENSITKKALAETLKKFVSSKSNENNYNISVEDNVINIAEDSNNYQLNYDLTNKPTFWIEADIKKGISYEDYQKITDTLFLPMLGYLAIANIQGVEFEDAITYYVISGFGKGSFSVNTSSSYMIIDDTNLSDGITIETTNPNVIYVSKFGERVVEYVNGVYPENQVFSDSEDINSYKLSIERKNTTETSCKLLSTLTVNVDADFSKLSGTMDKIEDSLLGTDITKETADFSLTLKQGQKCKLNSTIEFSGHAKSGSSIEISEDYSEITAVKTGTSKLILYTENDQKTFYITVEENTENKTLDPISLTIGTIDNIAEKNNNITQSQESINKVINSITKLPQTGDFFNEQDGLFALIIICVSGILFLLIPNMKYKNIEK